MANLLAAWDNANKLVQYTGFSSTVTTSIAGPSTGPRSASWTGTNLISSDENLDKIYQHSGFSTTISSSFAAFGLQPTGVTWDQNNNVYEQSQVVGSEKNARHSGFTSTISTSFATVATAPFDMSWDGSNCLEANGNIDKLIRYTGFTSTVAASITGPSTQTISVSKNRNGNFYSGDTDTDKYYLHSGFTTTISSSYASGDTSTRGCEWDEFPGVNTAPTFSSGPSVTYPNGTDTNVASTPWTLNFTPSDAEHTGSNELSYDIRTASGGGGSSVGSGTCTSGANPAPTFSYTTTSVGTVTLWTRITDGGGLVVEQSFNVLRVEGQPTGRRYRNPIFRPIEIGRRNVFMN